MNPQTQAAPAPSAPAPSAPAYEAPAIEAVIMLEELEREVFYAGAVLPSGGQLA